MTKAAFGATYARGRSCYHDRGRIHFDWVSDDEALAGFDALATLEGLVPALESAHALAYLLRDHTKIPPGALVVVNLSGRGDKDVETVLRAKAGAH